jgi:hypothetical protein
VYALEFSFSKKGEPLTVRGPERRNRAAGIVEPASDFVIEGPEPEFVVGFPGGVSYSYDLTAVGRDRNRAWHSDVDGWSPDHSQRND